MVTQAANRGPGQWMGGDREDKEKKVLISAQKKDHWDRSFQRGGGLSKGRVGSFTQLANRTRRAGGVGVGGQSAGVTGTEQSAAATILIPAWRQEAGGDKDTHLTSDTHKATHRAKPKYYYPQTHQSHPQTRWAMNERGGEKVGGTMWRKVADHICGDTQGNFHFLVTFTQSFFSVCCFVSL